MDLQKRIVEFEKAKKKVDLRIKNNGKLHVIVVKNGDDEVYYKDGKFPFSYDGMSFVGSDATPECLLKMYNDCKMYTGNEKVDMDVALGDVIHNLNHWRSHKKYSF